MRRTFIDTFGGWSTGFVAPRAPTMPHPAPWAPVHGDSNSIFKARVELAITETSLEGFELPTATAWLVASLLRLQNTPVRIAVLANMPFDSMADNWQTVEAMAFETGSFPRGRPCVAQIRMDYRRPGHRAPRLQFVCGCFSFAALSWARVAGVQFGGTARAHRGRQYRASRCHRHMVPDLQGQRVEGAGECGGSFAVPAVTRHKNARRLEPTESIDRKLSSSLRTIRYSFRRGLRTGAATGRSPSRAAHHECPLACDRSSFSSRR